MYYKHTYDGRYSNVKQKTFINFNKNISEATQVCYNHNLLEATKEGNMSYKHVKTNISSESIDARTKKNCTEEPLSSGQKQTSFTRKNHHP